MPSSERTRRFAPPVLLVSLLGLMSAPAPAAAQAAGPAPVESPAAALTAPVLPRLRGFDARVREAFEQDRGKPLVRAEKRPPLRPGSGNYVRHYSFSIVDFATRCLVLNEQVAEANAALIENAQYYLDRPADLDDRDSFYWHTEMLCRLIEDYGAAGRLAPGRLSAEAERRMLEVMWRYVSRRTTLAEAEAAESQTWLIAGSENHHLQHILLAWHFARLARARPEFLDRPYGDGAFAEAHHAAWTGYLKRYALERARKGLFVEVGSDGYNTVGMKGFYNVYDYAGDPELRRRAGCLLDLWWAAWAQLQIDGVQGGGRSRIYPSGGDRLGSHSNMRELAWFYFGIGERARAGCPLLSALLSSYRPPPVLVDLAGDVAGRGCYEVRQRPLGLAREGQNQPPAYRLRTDQGGILRYAWCTPDFILGTLMTEALPWTNWTSISSQNRWLGALFAGHPNARIVPQCRAHDDHAVMNAQWSAQSRGSLICQKLKTHKGGREMRVWFSEPGLSNRVEEAGWVFTEAQAAFAGVRVAAGGAEWEESDTRGPAGQWLRLRDEFSPVILEVARRADFPDYAAFRKAARDLPLTFTNQVLTFTGLAGDAFTFHADQSEPPLINGEPPAYAGPAFDSPFVTGAWDAGVITIRKGGRTLTLDFNAP